MATRSDIPCFLRSLVPCFLLVLPPFMDCLDVRSGLRLGSFQLKATLYYSKSRVFNCFILKRRAVPPPLGVAEVLRVQN